MVSSGAALITYLAMSVSREQLQDDSDPDPVADLREQYAAGEIDHVEFERQLVFYIDDHNERIWTIVEDINGVGPATGRRSPASSIRSMSCGRVAEISLRMCMALANRWPVPFSGGDQPAVE
ncbi:SHOCT domain-containing protein [Natrinema sp. 1APR25-10V2]|uniref:SHOCT domain-containing protein n=1 Tax=Natrinema sp. 1APR25-10V2 TaxID=2951081 RepID=UPI0028769F45|nr:SHOCT domain-containing protein [Natrinema sp. 1APR25-10V2]MDS0478390.1 SHOCT domain-containing protein [Natrinema sp. 1APR25-10V2]